LYAFKSRVTASNHGERLYTLIGAVPIPVPEATVPDNETLFRLYVPEGLSNNDLALSKLKGLFLSHRGPTRVALHVSKKTALELPDEYRVEAGPELVRACKDLLMSL
jgi:hypothetical protein